MFHKDLNEKWTSNTFLQIIVIPIYVRFIACDTRSVHYSDNPFLCMDLTYITCLLKDGYGFKESTVLQVQYQYA